MFLAHVKNIKNGIKISPFGGRYLRMLLNDVDNNEVDECER